MNSMTGVMTVPTEDSVCKKDAERRYVDEHFQEYVEELREAVRRPSIAAQNAGMRQCAEYIMGLMAKHGIPARLLETGGHPAIYGEVKGKSDKTVLFYNHYDVQPPDPLDEWESGPFAAEIRDGKMFGRGTSDNKGNTCARIQAVGALLKTRGELPVNVKFLIEGEEEIGSVHLGPVIRDHVDLLKADCGVWESGYLRPNGQMGIYLGVKGILYVEYEAQGAPRDMHSGAASSVPNPAWRLVWALSTIKDENEKILIPGFYDDVLAPTQEEIEYMKAGREDGQAGEERHDSAIGIKSPLLNLRGLERDIHSLFSPTANICGFRSGYIGEGQKTVLPSRALVKMDFRLVPNQDPEDILAKLKKHLADRGFDDIKVRVVSMDYPVKTPADHWSVKAAADAALSVYGKPASISPTQGGSGPMHPFKEYLGLPMVAFGVGYWGNQNHGPNENIRIEDYRNGIKMAMEFLDQVAKQ